MARRHGNLSHADLAPGWFAFPSVAIRKPEPESITTKPFAVHSARRKPI